MDILEIVWGGVDLIGLDHDRDKWRANIIRIMMSRRMGWESQRERGHYEDQDVGGWIIL
jgi:hypothetical protein